MPAKSALQFSNNSVEIPDHASLNTSGPYAARTWLVGIETPSTISGKYFVMEQGGYTNGISVTIEGGVLYANAQSGSQGWSGTLYGQAPIQPDTVYFVAFVHSGASGTVGLVLVDSGGNVVADDAMSGAFDMNSHADSGAVAQSNFQARFHDGSMESTENFGDTYFLGKVCHLSAWDYAMSASEVASRAFADLDGTETDLLLGWNFDEGSGSALNDVGPNSLDGTISGSIWTTLAYGAQSNSYYRLGAIG